MTEHIPTFECFNPIDLYAVSAGGMTLRERAGGPSVIWSSCLSLSLHAGAAPSDHLTVF